MATVKIKRVTTPAGMLASLREYEALLDRVAQRAYEIFDSRGQNHGQDLADWFTAEGQILGTAVAAVEDRGSGVRVQVSLPGFKPSLVTVEVGPGEMIVRAESLSKNGRPASKVMRRVCFPAHVKVDGARATLEDGILVVDLPVANQTASDA